MRQGLGWKSVGADEVRVGRRARSRAALGLRPPVDRAGARTDGCSFYPEGNVDDPELWRDCCVAHDMAYWQGGTADERRGADVQLSDCVLARTGSPGLAKRMYRGVRLSGAPLLPTTFRWAYGWGFGRGYAPLDATERQRAAELLAAYRRGAGGQP